MRRWLPWAVVSGLGLALSFPTPDLHLLVWFSLVPLFVILRRAPAGRCWWAGFVAGFVWRSISLYWITHVMVLHGNMSVPVGVGVTALLALWMALNTGLVALLVPYAARLGGAGPVLLAAAWVSLEYLQTVLPFGFPWSLLGYAAGRSSVLMQGADIAGVWGLSFLAVLVNAAIAERLTRGRAGLRVAATAAVLLLATAGYGVAHLAAAPAPGEPGEGPAGAPLRVAAVQGNVAQGRVWAPEELRSILATHVNLSLEALATDADLILWPESSVPVRGGLQGDPSTSALLQQFARQHGTPLVVGSPHFERAVDGEFQVTNAAFLLRADGTWAARYDKVRLVPWGEYVPLSWLFRFVTPLVEAVGSFRRGEVDQELFADPDAGVPPFGMAICYEVVFPDHVRRQTARGAAFLATITNDAWFGDTFAPYQHFSMARLRAVENRRYLVRAANTGISGMIDPWGRVLARTRLNETALARATIYPRTTMTVYALWGDFLPRLCVLLSVAGLLLAARSRRPPNPPAGERPGAEKADR